VSNDADLKVVELLLKKFPDAADTTDKVFPCRSQHICHIRHMYVTYIYDMYNDIYDMVSNEIQLRYMAESKTIPLRGCGTGTC